MNRILESKLNSAKRSPELSVSLPELNASLPMGRSAGRSTGHVIGIL
ncbi:hypothetical protein [Leptospira noguchii]|uniref:Uncharacterized protein n=1 Tax=Leptospira noguchii TaxID=28182 RepID=A0AAE9GAK1_9LEPT|nr:hypothetical protein [Leptospira noguchii]UOG30388.1 hypothetical protein MAL06_17760 [Leptospira noguchii]UOG56511.1 hypothetical protein MAL03_17260 [Leptospira noguchii]